MANCCCSCCEAVPPVPKVQYVGEPKLCSILCGQEVDQSPPNAPLCYRRLKSSIADPEKLYFGVLQSFTPSNDKALFFDDTEMNGQRYAMCLKAFAFLFIVPVYKWTRKNLDNLMQEGAELYSAGPDEAYEKAKEQAKEADAVPIKQNTVYSSNEQAIRRSFKLEGYEFEVELGDKFIPDKKDSDADRPTSEININSLNSALKEFLKAHKYGLLSFSNLYLFVWKSNRIYFLLDFYGRTSDLELLRQGGFATLICMREVKCFDYLIAQKCGLSKKDTFTLRQMRIALLIDPEGNVKMCYPTIQRAEEFVKVSAEYAYLMSKVHLSLREKDPLISRCGLPVGVAAIIASKIDHPAAWDTKNLEKIICYGFYICQCCWQFCQNSQTPVDFDSFPNQLRVGQFAVRLKILARISQGVWRCVPRIEASELPKALDKCWNECQNSLLLSIRKQTYAIWRKNGFYYLFDPYRHRLPNSESRSASLRMFSNKELLFNVLNLILLQNNTKTTFYIHRVIVTAIEESTGAEPTKPPCLDELADVKSINDNVIFREDFKQCLKDLCQVSEDEEEDSLIDEVFEESEPEPPAGEEEGNLGGGEMEDVGDEN